MVVEDVVKGDTTPIHAPERQQSRKWLKVTTVCPHTKPTVRAVEIKAREAQRRRVVMVVMVEVVEESSASSHRLAKKESKGGGCKEGWEWEWEGG